MSNVSAMYLTEELKGQMATQEMTVYAALSKRKIYRDRLQKLLDPTAKFVGTKIGNPAEITGLSEEDFINKCKSNYDKAVAVIHNFHTLNAAITKSNAETIITIDGDSFTVAEAIVRYDQLNAEISFLNKIAEDVAKASATVTRTNTDKLSEDTITKHVTKVMEALSSTVATETDTDAINVMMDKIRADYITNNTCTIIDPYDHMSKIEGKMEKLREYMSQFNEALNICNMQTVITVDLLP